MILLNLNFRSLILNVIITYNTAITLFNFISLILKMIIAYDPAIVTTRHGRSQQPRRVEINISYRQ
jgi:hypothetical protein